MSDRINTLEETKKELGGDEIEMAQAKLANLDDNVLLAQGHAPVLRRTFDLLGSLGLGFRYEGKYVALERGEILIISPSFT